MKKLSFVLVILLIGLLTACEQMVEVVELEPVLTPQISIELHTSSELYQGNHDFTRSQLHDMLGDIEVDISSQDFMFLFDLVAIELSAEIDAEIVNEIQNRLFPKPTVVIINSIVNHVSFSDLYLPYQGVYTFKITQQSANLPGWQLDETVFYFDVIVTLGEDATLAIVELTPITAVFMNGYVYDLSAQIEDWLIQYEQARMAAINAELARIEEVFLSFGAHTSFYFYNIATGFSRSFNADHVFYGASTPKVWYSHFLYLQDELGEITLSAQERIWIQYALRTSIDEFSLNLQSIYGLVEYYEWLAANGIDLLQSANPFDHFGLRTQLTAREALLLMQGVEQYFLTATANALEFRENMINNQAPFIVSDHYDVASKNGWLFPYQIRHDVAIINASSPYILIILTQNTRIANNTNYYFRMFSGLFETFNDRWFNE